MKRRQFLMGSAATAAAVMAPSLSAAAQTEKTASRDTTTITFSLWMTGAEFTTMQKLLKTDFQKRNPGITVKIVNVAGPNWGRQKVETLIAGGQAPDVMQLNTGQFEAFAARGALLDLDPYFTKDKVDLNAYVAGTWPGCKYTGKIYGTPRFLSVHATYFNRGMFRKAGIPDPKSNWTWNEFRAIAKELTNPKKNQVRRWHDQ